MQSNNLSLQEKVLANYMDEATAYVNLILYR